jgi:hypothetical protein
MIRENKVMLKIYALIFKFLVSNIPANRHRGQVDTFVPGLTVKTVPDHCAEQRYKSGEGNRATFQTLRA